MTESFGCMVEARWLTWALSGYPTIYVSKSLFENHERWSGGSFGRNPRWLGSRSRLLGCSGLADAHNPNYPM